ncbi:MAG TPA: oxidoreductase, partial [Erythrobacter sp.]|nr:oxidoreductase [Erythrobacter sp.]
MDEDIGTSPDEVQFRSRNDEPVDHGTVTVDSFLD